MIQYIAIVPHSPVLLPHFLSEEKQSQLSSQTTVALEFLARELYCSKPDTFFIISPHAPVSAGAFLMNVNPIYKIDFSFFGDFGEYPFFSGDIETISWIQSYFRQNDIAFRSISNESLDYGTSLPLFYLGKNLKDVKIIPLFSSLLGKEEHYHFGKELAVALGKNSRRIAIIISIDLTKSDIEEDSKSVFPFDEHVLTLFKQNQLKRLSNIDHHIVENSNSCAQNPLLILAGIINNLKCYPKLLSYERMYNSGLMVGTISLDSL